MSPHEFETIDDASSPFASSVLSPQPHLFVALEADRPLARGARYGLVGVDEVIIGRSGGERAVARVAENGKRRLYVRIPGRSMSSTHARLIRTGAQWLVEDAGSRN